MSSEQFEHIRKIRQTYRGDSELSKTNQINMIKILADDLNKTNAHFIFELIQNAEDNTYEEPLPYISFQLTRTDPTHTKGSDGALIVKNNEVGFNQHDVAAICAVGQSTKRKEQGYIGEKGIGFKSVFRVTENPHLFSKGYHFCLPESDEETQLGYIVPRWINSPPEDLNLSETHIILPLTKPDFGYDKIEEMLRDIEPEVILFLSTLQEIRIKTDTGIDFIIVKDDERAPEVEIYVENDKVEDCRTDDFLICTKTFNKPVDISHEKREGVENREVSIAFPLDKNSTAIGKIFAYLPVRSDTGLPFLINADFILPSSREDIHQDVPWNRWLMECVADLVVEELLPLLKEREYLNIDFLEILASGLNNLAENKDNLFYPIFSKTREAFMNEEFLPTDDETFVSAQNAKLADSEGLIGLLNVHQLSLLFEKSGVTKWLLSLISARRTQNLWKYLRDELKIDEVDPEMFARRINKSFLYQQCDDWFIDFYKFLSVGARPPRSLWASGSGILQNKPILRLQDKSLVNPNEPNVYLSKGIDSETTSRLIKVEISQNEYAHKFLKELGIQEWDLVAEVMGYILPKYRDNSSVVSKTEYSKDFSKIVSAYTTDSEKKKNQLREALLATPFILAQDSHTSDRIYLKPNQLCFGTEGLWSAHLTGSYSHISVDEEVCQFLKKLGILQWDIVDEVIEIILPKYRQDSQTISIKDHLEDFNKIDSIYKDLEDSDRIVELKDKLQLTPFILTEDAHEENPDYRKPTELYFGTEELREYFDGNDSCAFVNLEGYPCSAQLLFEDLGVRDSVQIKRKKGDVQGRVVVNNKHRRYKRGLNGFDPDIEVDGLDHAVNDPTLKKSAFIWNEIARPNVDCIRGEIQSATNQQYINSEPVEQISNKFGRLLINTAWLPDSDGKMHKPNEITLDDLPDLFNKDERLAEKLNMPMSKSHIIDMVAPEIGVSSDILNQIINAPPETIERIKSLLRSPSESISIIQPTPQTVSFPVNRVSDPIRRTGRVLEELESAPDQEYIEKLRSVRTTRNAIDPKTWLSEQYMNDNGQVVCQICQEEMPFKYQGRSYYFDAVEMLKGYFTKEYEAQFLALCPQCSPKYKMFVKQVPEAMKTLRDHLTSSNDLDNFEVSLKLDNWDMSIKFVETHWHDLKAVLHYYENSQDSEESID